MKRCMIVVLLSSLLVGPVFESAALAAGFGMGGAAKGPPRRTLKHGKKGNSRPQVGMRGSSASGSSTRGGDKMLDRGTTGGGTSAKNPPTLRGRGIRGNSVTP